MHWHKSWLLQSSNVFLLLAFSNLLTIWNWCVRIMNSCYHEDRKYKNFKTNHVSVVTFSNYSKLMKLPVIFIPVICVCLLEPQSPHEIVFISADRTNFVNCAVPNNRVTLTVPIIHRFNNCFRNWLKMVWWTTASLACKFV